MNRFYLFLLIFLFSCQSPQPSQAGWQKVFQNDAEGNVVFGEKAQLMDAVRLGYPVRIGWGSNRIEHVADADFLTIFEGEEVFAQIKSIIGQAPRIDGDSLKIRFRTQNHWTKIAGTNSYSTGMMTDYFNDSLVGGETDRYSATTWYVLYPAHQQEIEARPLWRKESANWEKWEKLLTKSSSLICKPHNQPKMKNFLFLLGMILLLGACQTPNSTEKEKPITEVETPAVKTAFNKQLELHGSELLYAYYCLGTEANIASISQKLGYTMMGDILYMIRHDFNPKEYAILKSEIAGQVDAMSEAERKVRYQEAALFLKVMNTINGETCGIDGETYSEILNEIPETQAIVDKYIDPQMGQSTSSLASGQAQEIALEVWLYITRAQRSKRLRIIADFLKKCSNLDLE